MQSIPSAKLAISPTGQEFVKLYLHTHLRCQVTFHCLLSIFSRATDSTQLHSGLSQRPQGPRCWNSSARVNHHQPGPISCLASWGRIQAARCVWGQPVRNGSLPSVRSGCIGMHVQVQEASCRYVTEIRKLLHSYSTKQTFCALYDDHQLQSVGKLLWEGYASCLSNPKNVRKGKISYEWLAENRVFCTTRLISVYLCTDLSTRVNLKSVTAPSLSVFLTYLHIPVDDCKQPEKK